MVLSADLASIPRSFTEALLNWEIETFPDWGIWMFDPESGTYLPVGDPITVEVEVVAPADKNMEFTGTLKVINSENPSDFCEINVVLKTPRVISYQFPFLQRLIESYLNAFPILRQLLGRQ